MPSIGVSAITAKSSDFGHDFLAPTPLTGDQHNTEMRAYGKGLLKHGEHLIGRCTGGDIKILGFAA